MNSYSRDIVQLRGKTNTLTRNVEETRSTITDMDARLSSEIRQNAGEIALRVRKDSIISEINISPEAITIQAQRIDLKGLVNAQELVSKFTTISTLNAEKANLQNLISQKATIDDLNAVNARVGTIEANYISASKVKAEYMEITNWTSAGKIRADGIDVEQLDATKIVALLAKVNQVQVTDLIANDGVHCARVTMGALTLRASNKWKTISVNDTLYTVLCQS